MKKLNVLYMNLVLGILAVFVCSSPLIAATTAQMKACKIAALDEPRLRDFPMAAISVRPGQHEHVINFTVRWDGADARGHCKANEDGTIREVVIRQFHGESDNRHSQYAEQDGFWRDNSGRWIDPDGNVCHSCTPDNGFPAAEHGHSDGYHEVDGFYYDQHIGQWRDPDGQVCHSCTPENGFPRH